MGLVPPPQTLSAVGQIASDAIKAIKPNKQLAATAAILSVGFVLFKKTAKSEPQALPREVSMLRHELTVSNFDQEKQPSMEEIQVPKVEVEESKDQYSFQAMVSKTCLSPVNVSRTPSEAVAPVRFLEEQIIVDSEVDVESVKGRLRKSTIPSFVQTNVKKQDGPVSTQGKKRCHEEFEDDNYSKIDLLEADELLMFQNQPQAEDVKEESILPSGISDAIEDLKEGVKDIAEEVMQYLPPLPNILPNKIVNFAGKKLNVSGPVLHGTPSSPSNVKHLLQKATDKGGKVVCHLPKSKKQVVKKWVQDAAKSLEITVEFV